MNNKIFAEYKKTKNILNDMREIIEISRKNAYQAINVALVRRNWLLGKRIAEEEMNNKSRAEYGMEIIKQLSESLTKEYGKGFTKSNLYSFYSFYKLFPNIFHTVCGKSEISEKFLSWSHYRTLIAVKDSTARQWYTNETAEQNWSVRTLQRNIDTQYYNRLLSSQNKQPVEKEMKSLTKDYQKDKFEYIKNPFIAEFLDLSTNIDLTENKLETAILSNLQRFIMEMGKGYAFVARQQTQSIKKTKNKVLEVYGAKNKNTDEQLKSSSGGIFSIFANYVLENNGIVFGASFDNNWNVVHKYIDKKEDLDSLRRSKYVQSDINITYKQAKQFLEDNRLVLFIGTPCQIAGLKSFLQKNYENLITIELFCHSIPSPLVWQMWLQENFDINNIKQIDFRDKEISWDNSIFKVYFKDNTFYPKKPKFLKFLKSLLTKNLYVFF